MFLFTATSKALWAKLQSITWLSKVLTLNWEPERDSLLYYLRDRDYCHKLANLRPQKPHSLLSLIYPSIKAPLINTVFFYDHNQGGSGKGGSFHHLIRTYLLSPLRLHRLGSSDTKVKPHPAPQGHTPVSSVLGIRNGLGEAHLIIFKCIGSNWLP